MSGPAPLRVLHVYRTYFPDTQGGLEEAIRQIAAATRPHGIESRVFTLSAAAAPAVTSVDGVAVHRARRSFEIASCGVSWAAPRVFRPLAVWAEVIHVHYPWPFADLLCLLARPRRPIVLTYHSDIVRQRVLAPLYAPLRRVFFRRLAAVVVTSPGYAATSPVLRALGERVRVIPLGLAETRYAAPEAERIAAWRARLGEGFALFVGVLRTYKGLDVLLDAAAGAALRIVIAGDGPLRAHLERRIAREGLAGVTLLGRVEDADKTALLHLCAAVVLPSDRRSEAFGLSLVEGAMAGKPLVSTDLGTGTSYVNIDGETGLVVPPADAAALAAALARLSSDPACAAAMGRAARARYEAHLDGRAMGEAYAALYREMVRGQA